MMQNVHVELNRGLPWQKQNSARRRIFTSNLVKKKQENCYIWSIVFYGAETWTLRKVDKKYLERCWRKVVKLIWTDLVRNEEILHRVEEERNILRTFKKRMANLIGHILHRNCLPRHVIKWKIEERLEVIGRRGKRGKQLLDTLRKLGMLEPERGNTRPHSVENSLCNRVWTCRKTVRNEC